MQSVVNARHENCITIKKATDSTLNDIIMVATELVTTGEQDFASRGATTFIREFPLSLLYRQPPVLTGAPMVVEIFFALTGN